MTIKKIETLIQQGLYQEAQAEISRHLNTTSKNDLHQILLLKAKILLRQGLKDEALELLENLITEIERKRDVLSPSIYLKMKLEYSRLLLLHGNKNSARQSFKDLIHCLETIFKGEPGISRSERSYLLGRAYLGLAQAMIEIGLHDRVEKLLNKALTHSKESKDPNTLLVTLITFSIWSLIHADLKTTNQYLLQLEQLVQRRMTNENVINPNILADYHTVKGVLALYQGDFAKSREFFIRGLRLKEEGRNLNGKIHLLHYLAVLANFKGNCIQSQLLFEAAIRICKITRTVHGLASLNFERYASELMLESFPPQLSNVVKEMVNDDDFENLRQNDLLFVLDLARISLKESNFEEAARYLQKASTIAWKNQSSFEKLLVDFEHMKFFIVKNNDPNMAISYLNELKNNDSLSRIDQVRLLIHESLIALQTLVTKYHCQQNHELIILLSNLAHQLFQEMKFLRRQGLSLLELEIIISFVLIASISGNYPKSDIIAAFERLQSLLKEKPMLKQYQKTVQTTFTSLFLTIEPYLTHLSIDKLPNASNQRLNQIFRAFILPTALHLMKQITNCLTKNDNHLHDLLSETFMVAFWFNTAVGPEILCSENTELFGNIQGVLQYMASTLILAIGQGSGYHEGTFGPLPFQLSADPDNPNTFSCLVHARKIPMSPNDENNPLNFRYVLFTFVFPKELLMNNTSVTFDKINAIFRTNLDKIKKLNDINEDLMFILRHHLLTIFL